MPFDPFPSTLFIVSFTLLRPVAETKEGGDVDERGAGTTPLYSLIGNIIKTTAYVLLERAHFTASGVSLL